MSKFFIVMALADVESSNSAAPARAIGLNMGVSFLGEAGLMIASSGSTDTNFGVSQQP